MKNMLETFACSQRIMKNLPYKDKDAIYSQKESGVGVSGLSIANLTLSSY